MIFGTNDTERMRIDSSGNVGINSTPSAWSSGYRALQIAGQGAGLFANTTVSQAILGSNGYYNGTNWIYNNSDTAGQYWVDGNVHKWFNAAGGSSGSTISFTQAMTLSAGQKLSIGTSATDIAVAYLVTQSAGDVDNIRMAEAGVTSIAPGIRATGDALVLKTSGSERMRIDSNGNLLVGKTDVSVTTNGVTIGNANYIASSRNSDVAGFFVRSGTDGDAVAFYKTTTNVGSISVTSSATSYNTSSDYRLKDINGPVVNSGAYIDALKPVQGSWKADGSRFIGLLAHEVQEVSETPIATGEKDGEKMQAMDYSAPELIANLIAEIQSLRARVAQLEGN
jgi:hypothetical protein